MPLTPRKIKVKSSFEALEAFGCDMIKIAMKFDPVFCRDAEIMSVIKTLMRLTKSSPILIGEPGVGKTAIVEGLAQRIANGNVPRNFSNVKLISLDMGALLVQGTKYMGELLQEVEEAEENVILFIDDIHLVLGVRRAEGSMDAANLLKQMLARDNLRCIGATTLEEYEKNIVKDGAFKKRFTKLLVSEPTVPDTIRILLGLKEKYEGLHGVRIQERALVAAAELSSRYITDRHLPDKAIDLVDKACARVSIQLNSRSEAINSLERQKMHLEIEYHTLQKESALKSNLVVDRMLTGTVGPDQIYEVLTLLTGIPLTCLGDNAIQMLHGLSDRLHQRVVGQNLAVDAVANAICRSRTGGGRHKHPNESFLFLGPSGVGKTELAKSLAEQLFDDQNLLVRINMSAYKDQHSVARLIGAPTGYVGHEEGQLTGAIKRQPYGVILFDEVEKAHTDVFDILLQVIEDGMLRDGQGRTVDFRNNVVILASNLGAKHLSELSCANASTNTLEAARGKVMVEVRSHFSRKLLSCLDELVVFYPLSIDQLKTVVGLQMEDVKKRFAKLGIALSVSDDAIDYVFINSFDRDRDRDRGFGARDIKRWLEKNVVTELSKMKLLMNQETQENLNVHINVGEDGECLTYKVGNNGEMMYPTTRQKVDGTPSAKKMRI